MLVMMVVEGIMMVLVVIMVCDYGNGGDTADGVDDADRGGRRALCTGNWIQNPQDLRQMRGHVKCTQHEL